MEFHLAALSVSPAELPVTGQAMADWLPLPRECESLRGCRARCWVGREAGADLRLLLLYARSCAPGLRRLRGRSERSRAGRESRREARPSAEAHAVEHMQTAAALEPQIEQNERRLTYRDRPQRLGGAGGAGHTESVRHEVLGEERARGLVVFHNQDQALLVHIARRPQRENLAPSEPALQTSLHNS